MEILYINTDFVVINKPSGVIVHRWDECSDKVTVMSLLKEQVGQWVYPVHRLDRPVSGVMVFALSSETARVLKESLESDDCKKVYYGLCMGKVTHARQINYPLKNQNRTKKQEATTSFWPISSNDNNTLVKFRIFTGRYHQIRRHCSSMGNHLVGDTKYGKGKINKLFRENYGLHRLFLHCGGLAFRYKNIDYKFTSPLPIDLKRTLSLNDLDLFSEEDVFKNVDEKLEIFTKKSRS
ncbi:MAG: tRNA pseudouridine(65) synthase TruC [Halobacteriovoraceae bacterium]|nr:tRNA pseudouridine(65) synthase TruC [Halobacteriovoraceae bacterium]